MPDQGDFTVEEWDAETGSLSSGLEQVLAQTLRRVLDAGWAECAHYPDLACRCEAHEQARAVWSMAEDVLAGAVDGLTPPYR